MKFFLISDNTDTQMGMRLAGIEGVVVHTAGEVEKALEDASENKDIAIVLITKKLVDLCHDKIYERKLTSQRPLIVEIPDRHATSNISDTISGYVSQAVGIRL